MRRNGQLRYDDPDLLLNNIASAKEQKYREEYSALDVNKAFLPAIFSTSCRIPGELLRFLYIMLTHHQTVNFFETLRRSHPMKSLPSAAPNTSSTLGLACAQVTTLRTHVAPARMHIGRGREAHAKTHMEKKKSAHSRTYTWKGRSAHAHAHKVRDSSTRAHTSGEGKDRTRAYTEQEREGNKTATNSPMERESSSLLPSDSDWNTHSRRDNCCSTVVCVPLSLIPSDPQCPWRRGCHI